MSLEISVFVFPDILELARVLQKTWRTLDIYKVVREISANASLLKINLFKNFCPRAQVTECPIWLLFFKKGNKRKVLCMRIVTDMTVHQETEYSCSFLADLKGEASFPFCVLSTRHIVMARACSGQMSPGITAADISAFHPWLQVLSRGPVTSIPKPQLSWHHYASWNTTAASKQGRGPGGLVMSHPTQVYDSLYLFYCENIVTSPPKRNTFKI